MNIKTKLHVPKKKFDIDLVVIRKDTQSYNELESAQSCFIQKQVLCFALQIK